MFHYVTWWPSQKPEENRSKERDKLRERTKKWREIEDDEGVLFFLLSFFFFSFFFFEELFIGLKCSELAVKKRSQQNRLRESRVVVRKKIIYRVCLTRKESDEQSSIKEIVLLFSSLVTYGCLHAGLIWPLRSTFTSGVGNKNY